MAHKLYIGIDNGCTGTIGLVGIKPEQMIETPVKKEQSYTKTKKNISRVKVNELKSILETWIKNVDIYDVLVVMERPMINPMRFQASISAARCLEAELGVIEQLGLPHIYVDSKQWQSKVLPKGIKGSDELKDSSHDIGIRLYPHLESIIEKHGDADGLLIAHWAASENL